MDPAECFTITWKIKNFSILMTKKRELNSPGFGMMSEFDSERWVLNSRSYVDKILFCIWRITKESFSTIQIRGHEISLVSSEDNTEVVLDPDEIYQWKLCFTFLNKNRHLFLPEDTLTVCCRIYKQGMKPRSWWLHSLLYSDSCVWSVPGDRLIGRNHNKVVLRKGRPQFDLKLHPGKGWEYLIGIYGPFFVLEASDIPSESKHQLMPTLVRLQVTFPEDKLRMFSKEYVKACAWFFKLKQSSESSGVLLFELNYIIAAHQTEVSNTDDFLSLYRDPWLSDVTLRAAGGESFPVHRAVLAARSPVFRDMFCRSSSGVVDIDDLDAVTLDRMLAFLYRDVVVRGMFGLDMLYNAAAKYGVRDLQHKCADMLSAYLSASSVCRVLALADRHADRHLAEHAFHFVRDHERAVVASEEWDALRRDSPSLCARIGHKLEEERASS